MAFKHDYSEQALIITQGLPGSGKSTWAANEVKQYPKSVVRVNRDTLRLMQDPAKWNPRFEKLIRKQRDLLIREALDDGKTVICDDTNLNTGTVDGLAAIATACDVPFLVNKDFLNVTVEECIRRDVQRKEGRCGKDVIVRMYYDYWSQQQKPSNEGRNDAILVDLDGTLALLPPGMSYPAAFDRDYRNDIVNDAVFSVLHQFTRCGCFDTNVSIILLSGRFSERITQTEEWLLKNGVPFDRLLCRKEGDRRPDTVVKKELYMEHIQGRYHVNFVLDDRPSVVRMWRAELGLPVFQVAPDLEF